MIFPLRWTMRLAAILLFMTAPSLASDQTDYLVKNLKQPGWKATSSGLQYHVLKAHDGQWPWYPERGVVTVNYEGRLIDGTVFDSSWQRGEPATFPLDRVIRGWQEGIPMMRVGETWEFAIPSDLAYGDRRTGPIPPGATLLFKVDLISVKSP
jgi:FKBP-type peptidyl-prolyl cis-trans isomerase